MDVLDRLLLDPEYVDELYERYQREPNSIPDDWAALFREFDRDYAQGRPGALTRRRGRALAQSRNQFRAARERAPGIQIYDLVHTFREHGHLIADLDPLKRFERSHPFLSLDQFGFSDEDLEKVVSCHGFHGLARGTVREHLDILHETYCGPIGVEYTDIMDADRRDWLQKRMEPIRNRPRLAQNEKRRLLRELIAADTFEQTLHSMYPGAKRFSLEGATTLIPLMRTLIDEGSRTGVEQMVIGMAHRGRLNVLAHVMGKPMEYILAEFEGRPLAAEVQGYGDVKYHMGYSSDYVGPSGSQVHLSLAFNPSHLETVNPVVEGIVRAKQERIGDAERKRVVPLLIHGDAAFTGQGVVAETFTLADLQGYRTGGTIHVIVNNQVGFTASPEETRSTRYASDIAKIIRAPVFHLNADHPEASYLFAQLAMGYRQEFATDVVIDLVGFRRHGHNEMDDASFTQPLMAELIRQHEPVSTIYGNKLKLAGVVNDDDVEAMIEERKAAMRSAREVAKVLPEQVMQRLGGLWRGLGDAGDDWSAPTQCSESTLMEIADSLLAVPEGWSWHPRLRRLMKDRRDRIRGGGDIDWGAGEALALGSLLAEGTPIRLSGQDAGRGTFSHRHAIYTDMKTGQRFIPLAQGPTRFEVINSPLSEEAVLGFEYGYSAADPWTLVLWEAQFGDFVNGAQVMIDQLIASAEHKWGRMSGLVMLLPHGYEGQGPEHSSARLERFLGLCAENNLQVANLTTPAQLFHCLRRQVRRDFRKPLVIMSPKSLLRHKLAVSKLEDFTSGAFQPIIDDVAMSREGAERSAVRRVLLTSGKIYYRLVEEKNARERRDVAVVRLEQLYPYPIELARSILGSYPNLREVLWVQEEPRNMGAWRNLRHRFVESVPEGIEIEYVGRDSRAVPATGAYDVHQREETKLARAALSDDRDEFVVRREAPTGRDGRKSGASAA